METVNNLENEIRLMVMVAEKCGASVARNKDGQVEDIFFTPFDLLRFSDFLVQTTVDNYEEIQNPEAV